MEFLPYLGAFASYFGIGALATAVFVFIYTRVTPHDEFGLIKEKNEAAAVALGGALLGFVIAVSGVIKNAVSLQDLAIWAVVALVVQLLAFGLVRVMFPKIVRRVSDNEMAAAIFVAAVSISAGLLNAASMTY